MLHETLDGIDSIWNFVLTAKNPRVVDQAVDFLIKLYMNVADDLKEHQTQCTVEFLRKCSEHLEKFRINKNNLSKDVVE